MTEPELTDDELAARLRAGLDALADEVGDPPPFPAGSPAPVRSHGRALALAAAAVVLLVAVGGIVVWAQRDRSPDEQVHAGPDGEAGADRPLVGTRWWLESAEDGGKAVEPARPGPFGLQLTDPGSCEGYVGGGCDEGAYVLWAADSCNGIARNAEVGAGAIVLGDAAGPSTLMACDDAFIDLLNHVFRPGEVPYEIHGDVLTVTRDRGVLTYRASDGPFGPTAGTVIDEGEVGDASYRTVYADGELRFEKGDTEHDLVQGGSGVGDDPGRINMTRESVMGRPYVMATVPEAAARVVYEAEGEAPVDLEIHRVDSKVSSVVAGFVDTAPETWQLVAYDAEGRELHRYGDWPREDMGAGRSIEEVVAAAGFTDCCRASGALAAFTSAGTAMTLGSGPLPPTMPRDPSEGLGDWSRVGLADASGTVIQGWIGSEIVVRFDCAETRYEVSGRLTNTGTVLDAARRLSAAAGCPTASIAEPG